MQVQITDITDNGTQAEEERGKGVVTGRVGVNRQAPPDQYQATVSYSNSNISELNKELGDGKLLNFSKCKHKICKLCFNLTPTNFCSSTITHRIYPCKNLEFSNQTFSPCDCSTSNVIYLITCNTCNMQYVGETSQKLSGRFQSHRHNINGKLKGEGNWRLAEHFNVGLCKNSSYSVQILENRLGTGRMKNGNLGLGVGVERRKSETEWILKLRTRYPYGLNNKIGDEFQHVNDDSVIGIYFPSLDRKSGRPENTRHPRNYNNTCFDTATFISNLDSILERDIKNAPNFIRVSLFSIKKKELRQIGNFIMDHLDQHPASFLYTTWYRMALDIIDTRIYKPPAEKTKRLAPKFKITIPFTSKAFDFINLPKILRSNTVLQNLPSKMDNDDIPMIVHKLTEPIRATILNYNKFVTGLDLKAFDQDNSTIPCHCHEFDPLYVNQHHSHILTGDLSIDKNIKLRTILSKGPKYREPTEVDFEEAQILIEGGMDDFFGDLAETKKCARSLFTDIEAFIVSEVKHRIIKVKETFIKRQIRPVLSDPSVKRELKRLHERFVLVSIDKAANNIAIICKRLYATIIHKELDFSNLTSTSNNLSPNSTYTQETIKTPAEIVQDHVDLECKYNLHVEKNMLKLPTMYWMPKMHKNPIGARFIIASKFSSLKPLAKDLSNIYSLFFKQVKRYHHKTKYYSGMNRFWVVENNSEIVNVFNKFNKRRSARSISTFDFSTLYTKTPHADLIKVLNKITDFAFSGGTKSLVSVTPFGANFAVGRKKEGRMYRKTDIKQCVEELINNCHFQVGNLLFIQSIGIPMGYDPTIFFTDRVVY